MRTADLTHILAISLVANATASAGSRITPASNGVNLEREAPEEENKMKNFGDNTRDIHRVRTIDSKCHHCDGMSADQVRTDPITLQPSSGEVDARPEDETSDEARSRRPRSTLDFEVTGIEPSSSRRSGLLDVEIYGRNLLKTFDGNSIIQIVGAEHKVLAKCYLDYPYGNLIISDNKIICQIGPAADSDESSGYVSILRSDGTRHDTRIRFTFKPDPLIDQVFPLRAPLTAKINITITGQFFDSIFRPELRLESPFEDLDLPCHTINASLINCVLPLFKSAWEDRVASLSLREDRYWLKNLQSYPIIILPDPQLTSFDPVDLDDMILKIHGDNLGLVETVDITVGPNMSPCRVINSDKFRIKCKIDSSHSEVYSNGSHFINWKLGEIEITLGPVIFISKNNSSTTCWGSWIFGFAFFTGVGVFILMWLRRKASSQDGNLIAQFISQNRSHDSSADIDHRSFYPQESSCNEAKNTAGWKRFSTQVSRFMNPYSARPTSPDSTEVNPESAEAEEELSQLRAANKLIALENLSIEKKIGEGHFSRVHIGTLQEPDVGKRTVAIKTLKDGPPRLIKELLREAVVMMKLKHPHVLPLIGVVFPEATAPILVIPFMSNSDLLRYVKREENETTVRQLVIFTLQVARGMNYLSDQKVLHRDLAARNCMLDDHLNVLVADFGRSRELCENIYSSDKVEPSPFKWMALESLQSGTFTSKSDVWSYAVTSWEVFTRGLFPYIGLDNHSMIDHLLSGTRLQEPSSCPKAIYQLWTRCWHASADQRPTFAQVISELERFISQSPEGVLEESVPVNQPLKLAKNVELLVNE